MTCCRGLHRVLAGYDEAGGWEIRLRRVKSVLDVDTLILATLAGTLMPSHPPLLTASPLRKPPRKGDVPIPCKRDRPW
jgi:hypothetical protein